VDGLPVALDGLADLVDLGLVLAPECHQALGHEVHEIVEQEALLDPFGQISENCRAYVSIGQYLIAMIPFGT
jgi:hypothetical protein